MTRAGVLALAALCSCAIDDRAVEVMPACAAAPDGGLISDFSTARLGTCQPGTCPDNLVGSSTVTLGAAGVGGLVFAYESPASVGLELGLTGDLLGASDAASALRVKVAYDSSGRDAPRLVAGIALRLVAGCLDTTGYQGVRFRVAGDLGTCPLRVAAPFADRDQGLQGPPCSPLDQCFAGASVAVATGATTVRLAAPSAEQVFAGMQWELGVPPDGAKTCAADFTIDDIELVAAP